IDTHLDEELQGQNPTEFYAYRHLERLFYRPMKGGIYQSKF
ncbi:7030_t:CDS:2, partial [Dentiscutata heterogama]